MNRKGEKEAPHNVPSLLIHAALKISLPLMRFRCDALIADGVFLLLEEVKGIKR